MKIKDVPYEIGKSMVMLNFWSIKSVGWGCMWGFGVVREGWRLGGEG